MTKPGEFVAEYIVTAADMNGLWPDWEDWTPTLVGITVGNGAIVARYAQIGPTVHCEFKFTQGSTGGVTGAVSATLPVAATQTGNGLFPIMLQESGGGTYLGIGYLFNTSTMLVRRSTVSGSDVSAVNLSTTAPFTWGSGDIIAFRATYEAA